MNEQKKMWYTYDGILFSHRKEWKMAFATWMDLGIIMLSEVSQTEKDQYHVMPFIRGIFKKDDTGEKDAETNLKT